MSNDSTVTIGSVIQEWTPDEGEPSDLMTYIQVGATLPLGVVESRRPDGRGGWTDWRSDEVGENRPRSLPECERDCDTLPTLGTDWAVAEYRVTVRGIRAITLGTMIGVPEYQHGTCRAAGAGVRQFLSTWWADASDWQDVSQDEREAVEDALAGAASRLWSEAMAKREGA